MKRDHEFKKPEIPPETVPSGPDDVLPQAEVDLDVEQVGGGAVIGGIDGEFFGSGDIE